MCEMLERLGENSVMDTASNVATSPSFAPELTGVMNCRRVDTIKVCSLLRFGPTFSFFLDFFDLRFCLVDILCSQELSELLRKL